MSKDYYGGGGFGGGGFGGPERARTRKAIDPSSALLLELESRPLVSRKRKCGGLLPTGPHREYCRRIVPPSSMLGDPTAGVTNVLCHTCMNKARAAVHTCAWTPDGRRVLTGNHNGEFTLWNGMAFNFETLIAGHKSAVRSQAWSRNGRMLISAYQDGVILYWESTMTLVHKIPGTHGGQPVRALDFAPGDAKFVSCADDGTLRVWDWELYKEERQLLGHGSDVKSASWHPFFALVASGSKDSYVKLWDPRLADKKACISTLYGHKQTVQKVTWNMNGNWLLTGSRDHTVKLFDIRAAREPLAMGSKAGHQTHVTSLAWHPQHERLFASGDYAGALLFWVAGDEEPVARVEKAHDQAIWEMAWHPTVGHVLATGANDTRTKFWCRKRPGDDLAPEGAAEMTRAPGESADGDDDDDDGAVAAAAASATTVTTVPPALTLPASTTSS